jgi:hypothetical protein
MLAQKRHNKNYLLYTSYSIPIGPSGLRRSPPVPSLAIGQHVHVLKVTGEVNVQSQNFPSAIPGLLKNIPIVPIACLENIKIPFLQLLHYNPKRAVSYIPFLAVQGTNTDFFRRLKIESHWSAHVAVIANHETFHPE